MKKLILVLVALVGLTVSAQAQEKSTSKSTHYLSIGYSIGNHQDGKHFDETSYPSIEYGVTRSDLSLGIAIGRGQTCGLAQAGDKLNDYYYEGRATQAFPITKSVSGNVVFGIGSYFKTDDKVFVEYGFGLTKSYGKITYGLSYSNWDSVNYVTPSVSLSF
jgi:hypothetical protein